MLTLIIKILILFLVFAVSNLDLLHRHVAEWNTFWENFEIKVSGNRILVKKLPVCFFFKLKCAISEQKYNQNKKIKTL